MSFGSHMHVYGKFKRGRETGELYFKLRMLVLGYSVVGWVGGLLQTSGNAEEMLNQKSEPRNCPAQTQRGRHNSPTRARPRSTPP